MPWQSMRHVTLNPTTGKTNDVTESKASGFIEEEQGTTGPTFEANDQTAEYSQFLTVHQDYSGSEVIPTVAGSSRKSFNGWRWWRRLEKDEEEHRLRVTKLEIYHPKKIILAALSYVP
uniref:Uncharacterized protein n=1 Tax=Vespula pensylvanica TaxID=30213 RepID=A0A834U532_VESPE|nr:hypothetical protein H0235_011457 [Vespula pensylvanica]